jgi:hypothetical protein
MAVTTAEPKEAAASEHGAVAHAVRREPADARAVQLEWLAQQEAAAYADVHPYVHPEPCDDVMRSSARSSGVRCRMRRTGRRGGVRHRRITACATSAGTLLDSFVQASSATEASAVAGAARARDDAGCEPRLEVSLLEVGGAMQALCRRRPAECMMVLPTRDR